MRLILLFSIILPFVSFSQNAAPVAVNDSKFYCLNDVITISLLENDYDVNYDTFTINSVTQPSQGSVNINAGNKTVNYTSNSSTSTSFTYNIIDQNGAISNNATVILTGFANTVNNYTGSGGTQQGCKFQNLSNVVVPSGTTSKLEAAKSVVLLPNTTLSNGSVVEIIIK